MPRGQIFALQAPLLARGMVAALSSWHRLLAPFHISLKCRWSPELRLSLLSRALQGGKNMYTHKFLCYYFEDVNQLASIMVKDLICRPQRRCSFLKEVRIPKGGGFKLLRRRALISTCLIAKLLLEYLLVQIAWKTFQFLMEQVMSTFFLNGFKLVSSVFYQS